PLSKLTDNRIGSIESNLRPTFLFIIDVILGSLKS
ncbi:MAG: hypothetical protein ACI9UT_003527, partial [Flavobacteriales bacterium]